MSNLFKKRADLREAWGKMPGENKGDFLHESKDRLGEELRRIFERQVVRLGRQVKLTDFESTGEFKDEDDIKDIYKNKPDIRDWILTNAKTIQAQGVTLYEVLSFKSLKRDRQESQEDHTDKIRQEEKVKLKAKTKAKGKAKATVAGEGEGVPPSEAVPPPKKK